MSRLHDTFGGLFLAVDHVAKQDFEAANTFGFAQPDELLDAQHHFLIPDLRVHRFERQRHRRLRLRRLGARHRVQGLRDLAAY